MIGLFCIHLFMPLYIGASGMQAQQSAVETIANNLANMGTTGYKRRRTANQDLLYIQRRRVGSLTSVGGDVVPTGMEIGLGVKTVGIYTVNEQGSPTQTSHPYHLAIQGNGYFQLLMPDGSISYTRDGTFDLSPNGVIVSRDGLVVQPGITIPQNTINITINTIGQVIAQIDGQIPLQTVGQLSLASFINGNGLQSVGDNLLRESPSSGAPIVGNPGDPGFGTLLQNYIEASNVNPVTEITNLITAQRAYEMNAKIIQTSDKMMDTMNQLR
jgi:flagellar basal-body rod protein FlgG